MDSRRTQHKESSIKTQHESVPHTLKNKKTVCLHKFTTEKLKIENYLLIKDMLFFQRNQVQFPAPTSEKVFIYNSNFREFNTLF